MTDDTFSLDAETYSPVNLRAAGADVYSRHPQTRCLMLCYHPVGALLEHWRLWFEGQPPPAELVAHILSGGFVAGWNVILFDRWIYERVLVARHGFPPIDADKWKDSMHLAAHANMPRSLDGCAKFLGLQFELNLKDSTRIRRITNATKTVIPAPMATIVANPQNYKPKLVEDLQWLSNRCVQDVDLEERVLTHPRMPPWPTVDPWLAMPAIDRRINDRGILCDIELVQGLEQGAAAETQRLDDAMYQHTNEEVEKTSTIDQLKEWLIRQGVELPRKEAPPKNEDDTDEPDEEEAREEANPRGSPWRVRKNDIIDLLAKDIPEHAKLALVLRGEAAKASTKKLRKMLLMAGPDGRLYGSFRLGGAQQTLRFAAAGWQPHNFMKECYAKPKDVAKTYKLKDEQQAKAYANTLLAQAIQAGRTGDADLFRMLYERPRTDAKGNIQLGSYLLWIATMMRRTLCAPEGKVLLLGDFSQVEARITAWLAQQEDTLTAFALGEDVYRQRATGIFHKALEDISDQERHGGKITVLACSFGGGWKAVLRMAYQMGLIMSAEEAQFLVQGFRESQSALRRYWYNTDDIALRAVLNPGHEYGVDPCGLVTYRVVDDCLLCRLPSGRELRYWKPRLRQEKWPDGKLKKRPSLYGLVMQGAPIERSLYHTTLVENQAQAIAADLICSALSNLDNQSDMPVVMHVHDSIAVEVDEDKAEQLLPVFKQYMEHMPAWTRGLPFASDVEYNYRFG